MERNLTHIALFTALIAILGLAPPISLGFGVPVTAQTLGIMLAGAVLGAKRGFLSALLLLVLGAAGMPVLAGGTGGLGVFMGPTVGFLIGFPFAAFVTGLIVQKSTLRPGIAAAIGAIIGGILVLYPFGIAGMALVLHKSLWEMTLFALVFVPGDLIKAVLTGLVVSALEKSRPASLLSRQ